MKHMSLVLNVLQKMKGFFPALYIEHVIAIWTLTVVCQTVHISDMPLNLECVNMSVSQLDNIINMLLKS